MSSEKIDILTLKMEQVVSQEYYAEWKISKISKEKSHHIRIPAFSPLPNVNLKLCFEIWYQIFNSPSPTSNADTFSIFKPTLLKMESSGLMSTMKLEVEMKIKYSDGTLFKEYRELPALIVEEMDCFNFDSVISLCKSGSNCTVHSNKMAQDQFIIACRMKFFDHLCTPQITQKEKSSLNKPSSNSPA